MLFTAQGLATGFSHRGSQRTATSSPARAIFLHIDVYRYARFEQPGRTIAGNHSQNSPASIQPQTHIDYDYAHAIIDDHSRLAYVELSRPDERQPTVTDFIQASTTPSSPPQSPAHGG